ncbi:MAG: hypothetical protein CVV06_09625 [Gammaproteobacteria bacterium HGW-Gammaproteobacteria-10]|nr:MAG: hypothetical protein CVV06_09625 [Gammaproteobacteria bacterium HGW-Gammaproteobacteria-10]
MKNNAGSEEVAIARPTGIGGKDCRRRAYKEVFTAFCRASNRNLPIRLAPLFAGAIAGWQ